MKSWLNMLVVILLSSATGAIGLSFLTMLLHWLFVPVFLNYWLAPLTTIPNGALLGATTGAIIALKRMKSDKTLAILNIISALVVMVWTVLTVSPFEFSQESVLYFGGLSLLWATGLLIYGFKSLISSR